VHEVLGDDAALDVAVVAAADAQQVLVGARVEFGRDLRVLDRGLQRAGARIGNSNGLFLAHCWPASAPDPAGW
jgi:hypothetical protein